MADVAHWHIALLIYVGGDFRYASDSEHSRLFQISQTSANAAESNVMTIANADRAPCSPIVTRPKLNWPNGARLALWVVPNIEH